MCRACEDANAIFWRNTHCTPLYRRLPRFARGSRRGGWFWSDRWYIYWLGVEWVYEPKRTP